MDAEGFPSVEEVVERLCPHQQHPQPHAAVSQMEPDRPPSHQDQESGEMTGQNVVVIRSSPKNIVWRKNKFHSSKLPQEQCRMTTWSYKSACIDLSYLTCKEPRYRDLLSPSQFYSNFSSLPKSRRKPADENRKTRKTNLTTPSTLSKLKPARGGKIIINIWKEMFLGDFIFQEGELNLQEIVKKYQYPYMLRFIVEELTRFLPYWFVSLFLLTLRILVPQICSIFYLRYMYVHFRIHELGEEQGMTPVFTGRVHQGPIIYSIRELKCPYCKYQRQSELTLKYFQSSCEERRKDMAVQGNMTV